MVKNMTLERRTLPQLLMFSYGLFAVQTFWGFNMGTFPLYLNEMTGSKSLTGIILSVGGLFARIAATRAELKAQLQEALTR